MEVEARKQFEVVERMCMFATAQIQFFKQVNHLHHFYHISHNMEMVLCVKLCLCLCLCVCMFLCS